MTGTFSLRNDFTRTTRTHARTNETKRFPGWVGQAPSPNLRSLSPRAGRLSFPLRVVVMLFPVRADSRTTVEKLMYCIRVPSSCATGLEQNPPESTQLDVQLDV